MNLEANLLRSRQMAIPVAVDLTHLPPFQLADLLVEPALLRLSSPGREARTVQPLAMRLLIALAEADGEPCSRDDLILKCWNARIVGDDAIHRVISTLRRDLALSSGEAVAIETIPKVGYRLRVEAGATDQQGVVASATTQPRRSGRPWLAAILIAGLASAAVFAATRASADVTAIAVVAEGDASGTASARFADGLTGDLARLASAMPTVAFVEPGGEQAKAPLLLRIALDANAATPTARVRLVHGRAGAVLWSREFAAEGGTLAELRERVANGITGVVQCGLDRSAKFDDPVGLRLYLGACEGLETKDFERARTFAQQITEYQPDAPAGWACLANSTIFATADNGAVDGTVLARAEGYARRALAADPKSGLAYVALAMARSRRGEPSLAILERGLRVDPDFAMLHRHYALALTAAGMVSKAVEPALRAVALHPHDPGNYRNAVAALLNAGKTDEALALASKMHRLWRYDHDVGLQRLQTLVYARDSAAALATIAASPQRSERRAAIIHETLSWRADPAGYDWASFDRVAREVFAERPEMAWHLSMAAARMGDRARALEWLERAPPDAFMAWAPMFAPEAALLRRDPQFFAKMASVGLVERWQKSNRWPDFCSDPALGYDCRRQAARLLSQSVG